MTTGEYHVFLRERSGVSIALPPNRAVVLGRGAYGIAAADKTVSRQHLQVVAHVPYPPPPPVPSSSSSAASALSAVHCNITPLGINAVKVVPRSGGSATADTEVDVAKGQVWRLAIGDGVHFIAAGDGTPCYAYTLCYGALPADALRPDVAAAATAARPAAEAGVAGAAAAGAVPTTTAAAVAVAANGAKRKHDTTTTADGASAPAKRARVAGADPVAGAGAGTGAGTGAAVSGARKVEVHHHGPAKPAAGAGAGAAGVPAAAAAAAAATAAVNPLSRRSRSPAPDLAPPPSAGAHAGVGTGSDAGIGAATSAAAAGAGAGPKRVRPRVSPLPRSPPRAAAAMAGLPPLTLSAAYFAGGGGGGGGATANNKARATARDPVTGDELDSAEFEALRNEKEAEAEQLELRRARVGGVAAVGAGAGAGAAGAWGIDAYPDRIRQSLSAAHPHSAAAAATATGVAGSSSSSRDTAAALRAKMERDLLATKAAGAGAMGAMDAAKNRSPALGPAAAPAVGGGGGSAAAAATRPAAEPEDPTGALTGRFTLAFPSISTVDFDFDMERAVPIAVRAVDEFLRAHPDPRLRLVFVDDHAHMPLVAAFDKYHATCDARLVVHSGTTAVPAVPAPAAAGAASGDGAGDAKAPAAASSSSHRRAKHEPADVCALKTQGYPARYILNPTNFRFSDKGTELNARLHRAVGGTASGGGSSGASLLQTLSLAQAATAKVGVPVAVQLPPDNALRRSQGVHAILQIRGPNMNPNRPDPEPDYATACALLQMAYANSFDMFYALTGLPPPPPHAALSKAARAARERTVALILGEGDGPSGAAAARNAADAAAPAASAAAAGAGAGAGAGTAVMAFPKFDPPRPGVPEGGGTAPGHWSAALLEYLSGTRSATAQRSVFWESDAFVAIYDRFPKARIHLLLMPKQRVNTPNDLRPAHIPMLKLLIERAQWIARGLKPLSFDHPIRLGFHASPSLRQLHLHIISTDFESACMTTKKHWLSFTHPEFFLDPLLVLRRLESGACPGGLQLDVAAKQQLLKGVLRCHRCGSAVKTMPALTTHVAACRGNHNA